MNEVTVFYSTIERVKHKGTQLLAQDPIVGYGWHETRILDNQTPKPVS